MTYRDGNDCLLSVRTLWSQFQEAEHSSLPTHLSPITLKTALYVSSTDPVSALDVWCRNVVRISVYISSSILIILTINVKIGD